MTATEQYVEGLTRLKSGDLGRLRTHAGQGLDETVDGFDLFAGLWWPLRKQSERAPRREVAWLIAKVYAFCPIPHSPGDTIARQLRKCQPTSGSARERFPQRFDDMLGLPLANLDSVFDDLGQLLASSSASAPAAKPDPLPRAQYLT